MDTDATTAYGEKPDDMQTARPRGTILTSAAVGAAGATIASALMLWAARTWDGVHLAQLLSERLTTLIPLSIFRELLTRLESSAKPATLVGLVLAQVALGAAASVLYARRCQRSRQRRVVGGAVLGILTWAALSFVVAPASGVGLLGYDAASGVVRAQATFVLAALSFAAVVASFVPWPLAASAKRDPSRRRFVQVVGVGALVLPTIASASYVARFARSLQARSRIRTAAVNAFERSPFSFPGMPPAVTPNHEFYIVSKNFIDPDVDEQSWTLEVSGLVERPLSLTYADVLARQSTEMTSTLECISNDVGGEYISTAKWRGFSLRDLLQEAGIRPGVVDIAIHAADDYVDSIPLAEGLAADTMLVHTMNAEQLPLLHGFPLRLIVPGIFGMKNVKWVTRIEAVGEDILGYWQQREWDDAAHVVTMSRVATPTEGQRIPQGSQRNIGGVAFAGDRGISKVEVSLDDGQTWVEADLSEPLSPLTWRLWKLPLETTTTGKVNVSVRATDGKGELQTSEIRDILPAGATGWHRTWFEVMGKR